MELVLEIRNLTKTVEGHSIVKGINFSVFEGESYGLLGPAGSGKSEIIEMMTGAAYLSKGDFFVYGMNGRKHSKQIRSQIGVLPQYSILDSNFSVIDNLILYASAFGMKRRDRLVRARDLLRFTSLEEYDNQPISVLSKGQRRRLSLAMALVNDPSIVVLDDPTYDLESEEKAWMWRALDSLKLGGKTLVLGTQSFEEAERICDRIMILDRGETLCEGEPDGLIKELIGSGVIEFTFELADLEYHLQKIKQKYEYQVLNNRIRLFLEETAETKAALDLIASESIRVRRANLDDVFLKVAGYNLNRDM